MIMTVLIVLCAVTCVAFFNQAGRQRELILTLLTPELQNASDEFYSEYLSDNPSVTYYSCQLMSLNKNEHGYIIKVGIKPYLGPHFPAGDDEAEFSIDNIGNITLLNFSHKNNYEFPERLGVTIKKPIPVS